MNNKRQTIWLVSMLSLMVILSAYYLFTEDVSTPSNDIVTTDGAGQQGAKSDATEASGSAAGNDAIVTNEVTGDGADAGNAADNAADNAAADNASADDKAAGDAAGDASAANDGTAANAASGGKDAAKSDEDVLKELGEAGGVAASVFSQLQEERDDTYYDEYNKLMGQVSDTKLSDKDAATSMEQLDLLEDKNAKITGLEEELSKQFGNAAVVPDANDRYKIVVESDKLERSQADSILTMAIDQLGLTPDQLTIQYVK
ncbi:SpoIIIAH-like family protein [Paenibacillus sp. MWE-103]|uniref:SpoIIIAH-like family protein n=1 Tax=Paenibacillus artemisiicola TaxID=1172618 RepID=A0ABS3W6R8_9BACL|nr:SpoIIIAH-like family protein [Paenibacillus artemisiicola]MBO7743988.1 SpoIIIAH-like family protein [Paenibacillus artemisiicola]